MKKREAANGEFRMKDTYIENDLKRDSEGSDPVDRELIQVVRSLLTPLNCL